MSLPLTICEEMEVFSISLLEPLIIPTGKVHHLEYGMEIVVHNDVIVDAYRNERSTHRIIACFATIDLKVLKVMALNKNIRGQIDIITVTRNAVNNQN